MTRSGSYEKFINRYCHWVLIPLLVDDPLWGFVNKNGTRYVWAVLIPLLVDDPLWELSEELFYDALCVLIPLLVDDPLWVLEQWADDLALNEVLIPLLVDDPLWVPVMLVEHPKNPSLNPSFSG